MVATYTLNISLQVCAVESFHGALEVLSLAIRHQVCSEVVREQHVHCVSMPYRDMLAVTNRCHV